jgi:ERCC4-type nuclease
VDLVVLYEPVPSEIRMIQRRGRTGRKHKGRMMVLITKGTRDEGYYWSSVHKERRMKEELGKSTTLENLLIKPLNLSKSKTNSMPVDNQVNDEDNSESEENHFRQKQDKPLVYADSREGNSRVLRELTKLGVEVVIKPLAVADYQVSEEVALERKTASDFVSSIADKRLYKQVKEMVEEFDKPLMILEGDNLYSGFMNPNAIRGALASVAVDFGMPIIPTRSAEDTAAMIRRIAIREQAHERPEIQVRTEKKPLTLWEQQLFIVESLPNVGPVNARKLLEEFGSVEEIVNASEEDLQKVDGIGKKIARSIRKVVSTGFKKIEKDMDQKLID